MPNSTRAEQRDELIYELGLKHRRREIAETLAAGFRTDEVAERFRLSPSRVSQLRREFESSWREFQREAHERQMTPA